MTIVTPAAVPQPATGELVALRLVPGGRLGLRAAVEMFTPDSRGYGGKPDDGLRLAGAPPTDWTPHVGPNTLPVVALEKSSAA